VPDAVKIEKLLDGPRGAETFAALDRIFFDASNTKSFKSDEHRAAFRERWLGRYLTHDPEWVYLAIQERGGIVGYLLGSLDDPATAPRFSDLSYFQSFAHLTARYPAQIHVNLAPEWRGQGIGGALMRTFVDDVSKTGVPGAHVITTRGMRNVSYYSANGFAPVGELAWNGRELLFFGRVLR
jgi:GNAT superfamily N-acetyltransferase